MCALRTLLQRSSYDITIVETSTGITKRHASRAGMTGESIRLMLSRHSGKPSEDREMAGTWTILTNAPPAAVATMLLMTDGSVLAQGVSTNQWYRLAPDVNGSYVNGSWSTLAASVHAPLYYASGVLRDGRVIVAGGEYDAGAMIWLLNVELYDPVANTWTTLANPPGWVRMGDAPGCVLPDGRFMMGQVGTRNTAIYDPATNSWTAAANKINSVGEESWSLLPDGTIHAVDCSHPPNAEKYIIAADQWVAAGATPQVLVDSISEIGPSVLLPDGRVFVIGATGFTALYTPPPIANQPGTWTQGPSIPQVNQNQPLGPVDAPGCVLPNGNVLFSASPITSPASFQSPTFFFEYDPIANSMTDVSEPSVSGSPCYLGRLLVLPNGEVLYSYYSTTVSIYAASGSPDPVWKPTITSCPTSVRRGRTYTLYGRQINGLNQGSYYGNDATNATNYPIVRLESTGSSQVYYCRTSNFSTMGLQTGTIVHSCSFRVPNSVPLGSYCLRVIANGIASECRRVSVTNKLFKELKWEIKEKQEIIENLKDIVDTKMKRIPDIDVKISEELDVFKRVEEEWLKTVRSVAEGVDSISSEMSRTFIGPEERPQVGVPEPVIEQLTPRKISAEEARRQTEKIVFADGRTGTTQDRQMEEFHEKLHNINRSRGAEIQLSRTSGRQPPPEDENKP
jgi:hypothetical protein